jgi:tetratricopeptide (TPR) repeat protein
VAPAPAAPAPRSADDAPAGLFALAQRELATGSELHARAMLMRVLTLDPGRHGDVLQLALDLARERRIDSAFGCIDVATDAALLAGDWHRAAELLQTFVAVAPHIPALIKLVEVCVDAGLDAPMRAAQAQLADAYLDAGSGAEARVIAEDLLEADPGCEAHAERLRRALELLGVADRDRIVTELCNRHTARVGVEGAGASMPDASPPEPIEIDLSDALSTIGTPAAPPVADEAEPYDRAMEHLQAGREAGAIAALEAAARIPRTRVKAAAELGRLYLRRGDPQRGIEWLERAADGPAATPDEGFAVLYELANALERLGEPARALAILVDLDADAGGYRDVRARIERLARAQAGSGGR